MLCHIKIPSLHKSPGLCLLFHRNDPKRITATRRSEKSQRKLDDVLVSLQCAVPMSLAMFVSPPSCSSSSCHSLLHPFHISIHYTNRWYSTFTKPNSLSIAQHQLCSRSSINAKQRRARACWGPGSNSPYSPYCAQVGWCNDNIHS